MMRLRHSRSRRARPAAAAAAIRGLLHVAVASLPGLACGPAAPGTAADGTRAMVDAAATITGREIGARIRFLADDALLGRATPSPGLDIAAAYVAAEFAGLGLADPAGGYIQWYVPDPASGTRAPNVIGVLTGADARLRDTFVVYTAHLDHVGTGPPDEHGDSIYNGADDDASGVAAILEIAQAFSALADAPARSIAFVLVSGEELGLLGSQAFLEAGPIPAAGIVANINIDMIGRNAPDTVVVIGKRYSTLGGQADRIASAFPELGLHVTDDPWPEEQFFFRSDHYNFAQVGIPAVFLFSGVHDDYHRPSDHADRIDAEKTARIAQFAFHLGWAVARDADAPVWTPLGRREVLR